MLYHPVLLTFAFYHRWYEDTSRPPEAVVLYERQLEGLLVDVVLPVLVVPRRSSDGEEVGGVEARPLLQRWLHGEFEPQRFDSLAFNAHILNLIHKFFLLIFLILF